jgi:hypothetical protein
MVGNEHFTAQDWASLIAAVTGMITAITALVTALKAHTRINGMEANLTSKVNDIHDATVPNEAIKEDNGTTELGSGGNVGGDSGRRLYVEHRNVATFWTVIKNGDRTE